MIKLLTGRDRSVSSEAAWRNDRLKFAYCLFCHITQSWRATPLVSRIAVVELIANTTTNTGLTVRCELDTNTCPESTKVSDEELAPLNLTGNAFHPD